MLGLWARLRDVELLDVMGRRGLRTRLHQSNKEDFGPSKLCDRCINKKVRKSGFLKSRAGHLNPVPFSSS